MKVISNTLKAVWDRFEDPGDYPNALAAGPLPPGPWRVSELEGQVVVDLTLIEFHRVIDMGFPEFVDAETNGIKMPDGIRECSWYMDDFKLSDQGIRLTLSCREFEPDIDYQGPEPPDHRED
jgi:hypothetical protein